MGPEIAANAPFQDFADQISADCGIRRVVPKGVQLLRVGVEVEQLALVAVDKVHQFPAVIADHGHKLGAVEDAIAGVLGEDVGAGGGGVVGEIGHQRARLHPPRRLEPGQLQHRRAEVEQRHQIRDPAPGGDAARPPNQGGDVNALFVHVPLLAMAVVVEAIAMVGGEDHDRILQHAAAFEGGEQVTDLGVDHGDVGEIVLALAAELFGGGGVEVDDGIVVVREVLGAEVLIGGGLGVDGGAVDDGGGKVAADVEVERVLRGVVGRMGTGDADFEEERAGSAPGVDPVGGEAGHEVVGMELGRGVPDEGAEAVLVVVAAAVGDAAGFLDAMRPEGLVPVVEKVG